MSLQIQEDLQAQLPVLLLWDFCTVCWIPIFSDQLQVP